MLFGEIFGTFLTNNGIWLIVFFVPFCVHYLPCPASVMTLLIGQMAC